ncbi:hypothetical protein KP509_16G059800 [Ceratopteris richardii]|uniref:SKP1 component POZ domain-containing protein n=1 Tax=Ceratopteris richardii TaxID=49495 RepID=A0A8T2T4Y2_CERRI|nr:hypothetical protein KP509_16G059800 [Ceratopteris richardii]
MRKRNTIMLMSEDGFKFIIEKKAAMASPTLNEMIALHGRLEDPNTIEISFKGVSSADLETRCQCLFTYCLE